MGSAPHYDLASTIGHVDGVPMHAQGRLVHRFGKRRMGKHG